MTSPRVVAAGYELAMRFGIVRIGEVTAWVDAEMAACADPPDWLVEACWGADDAAKVTRVLRDAPGEPDEGATLRWLFGYMGRRLAGDPGCLGRVVRGLYELAVDDRAPDREAAAKMWSLDDELGLAEDGIYGDVGAIRRETAALLARYGDAS